MTKMVFTKDEERLRELREEARELRQERDHTIAVIKAKADLENAKNQLLILEEEQRKIDEEKNKIIEYQRIDPNYYPPGTVLKPINEKERITKEKIDYFKRKIIGYKSIIGDEEDGKNA